MNVNLLRNMAVSVEFDLSGGMPNKCVLRLLQEPQDGECLTARIVLFDNVTVHVARISMKQGHAQEEHSRGGMSRNETSAASALSPNRSHSHSRSSSTAIRYGS
jgi:hypothetical protein